MIRGYGLTATRGLGFDVIVAGANARGLPDTVARSALLRNREEGAVLDDFLAPDGRWMQARMGTAPDGGFVVLVTDVTEYRDLTSREHAARQSAEAANQAKSAFLANMSHEIRTPLNAILGMSQVMAGQATVPEHREQLKIIGESGRSLLHVLNSLLDLSKIEAGKIELEVEPFDLEETVGQVVAAFRPLAEQKDLRLVVDVTPEACGVWCGDAGRMRQVLSNLVANALKFTAEGGVDLRFSTWEGGLAVEVADTGVGIPPGMLEQIFEKFTQADVSTTRRYGGTGLGLAICREFIQLMGGALEVTSEEGRGSTFSFRVPLQQSSRPLTRSHVSETVEPDARTQPLRILAAEDNPTNRMVLRALLAPFPIDLTIVDNGLEAVDAVTARRFDLILMDIQMPDMNGVEATSAIRALERAHDIPYTPILALTANVMRDQTDAYIAVGMDGFVAKPIDVATLIAAIDHALSALEPDSDVSAAAV